MDRETYPLAFTLVAATVFALCALGAARVFAEEAAPPSASYSAEQLCLSGDWVRLRDPRFTKGQIWSLADAWITNTPPEGTSQEDLRTMKNGVGLCLYVWDRPPAPATTLAATFAFDAHAAAGLILGARVDGNVLLDHYLVLAYHGGVNLWKYTYTGEGRFQGRYLKLAWRPVELAADEAYTLAATIQTREGSADFAGGRTIAVSVNNEAWFSVTDADPLPPGKVGLWLGEGLAKVRDVSIRRPKD